MIRESPISEFKAHCIAELKRVHLTGQPLIVTLRGNPIARVESVRLKGEPAIKLGSKPGNAQIKRDLVKTDFTHEWEMNRWAGFCETAPGYSRLDWATEDPRQVCQKVKALITNARHYRAVSTVSTVEIARLVWAKDVILQIPIEEWAEKSLADLRADSLPVSHAIAIEAYRLPEPFHRDPGDRQIVACARLHGLTIATADERILNWKHVSSIDASR